MTNAFSYTSPKMGGIQLVANTTFSNNDNETTGVGVRYSSKAFMAYLDFIDTVPGGASIEPTTGTETAIKVGGKFKTKAFHVAGQFESAEDVTGYDYIHVNGGFNINKNNSIQVTVGQASHVNNGDADTQSFAIAFNHKLSKMTNVYVAYGDKSSDTDSLEDNALALGIKKKF